MRYFLFICLFSVSCQVQHRIDEQEHGVKIVMKVYQTPALKLLDRNVVMRIDVIRTASSDVHSFEGLEISLAGTDSLSDIRTITLESPGETSDSFDILASTIDLSERMELEIDFDLTLDTTIFYLSLQVNDDADIDHLLSVACESLTFDAGIFIPDSSSGSVVKRLGLALRRSGDDGVHTFRIPGLARSNEGTLLAVYDVRHNSSADLQGDIDVGLSRSIDGGHTWAPMKIIMNKGEWGGQGEDKNGIGDPSILVDRSTGNIWVAALWTHGDLGARAWTGSQPGLLPRETGQTLLSMSEDDGRNWSDLRNITHEIKEFGWYLLLPGPGTGISLEDRSLVFPAQYKDKDQVPHSTLMFSQDHGDTWQLGTGARAKTTESQVVQLSDGSLMLNMRDDRGGARAVSKTYDMGKSWQEHSSSRKLLPEPICNASLLMHSYTEQGEKKQVLLFANPADTEQRKNMTIKASLDEGETWPDRFHLLLDEGRGRGYPSMTSIDEETIGIVYEGSQSDLVFQRVKLKDILEGSPRRD